MDTLILIALIVGGLVVFTGLIRVLFTPPKNGIDYFVQFFLLDWLVDLFAAIIEAICDSDPD